VKELDDAQLKAEQEKDKLDAINEKFAKAKADLDHMKNTHQSKVDAAGAAQLEAKSAPADVAEQKEEDEVEPPAQLAKQGVHDDEERTDQESTPTVASHAATAPSSTAELAQEASHVKLRSTGTQQQPKERSAEVCSKYELDMKATAFGLCMCGHPKTEHKFDNGPREAQFQTNAAARRASTTARPPAVATASPPSAPVASATSPTASASFVTRGNQYPSLEPCDNYQLDVSASAFGTCVCGHLKTHHKQTSPSMVRTSGDSTSGTFPSTRRPSLQQQSSVSSSSVSTEKDLLPPPVPSGTKPPPPARRPSVLSHSNSVRSSQDDQPTLERKGSESSKSSPPLEKKLSESSKSTSGEDVAPPPKPPKPASVDEEREKHRARLVEFYTAYNPEKIGEVDTILDKFKGKEQTLFKKLKEKYPDAVV
jgi:protein-tyrosine-phosphatase